MYTRFVTLGAVLVLMVIAVCVIRLPPAGSLGAPPHGIRSERRDAAVPASAAADRKGPRRRLRRFAHDNSSPAPFGIRNRGERSVDGIRPRLRRSRDPPYSTGGV